MDCWCHHRTQHNAPDPTADSTAEKSANLLGAAVAADGGTAAQTDTTGGAPAAGAHVTADRLTRVSEQVPGGATANGPSRLHPGLPLTGRQQWSEHRRGQGSAATRARPAGTFS